MESLTPFAQTPSTPELVIAQVQRQLADEAQHGNMISTAVLDRVADRAVRDLWESRVKTFVPVLALRQARELLQDQGLRIAIEPPASSAGGVAAPPLPTEWSARDVLHLEADVMRLEESDVQRL